MAETTEYSEVPQTTTTEKESPKTPEPPTEDPDVICLKPKMTLLNGCTVIIGSIIGSGIFVSPKGVLENTGSVGLSLVVCLKPKMTLLNGCTVIIGSIIGSGIFVSPKGVLENTGSVGLSLVVWITSGVFSMIGAYCYAELGCMITKTGADYAYIMESFGPFLAFIRLWIECMIVRPCSQAIVALTFSFYALRPIFPACDPPDDAVRYLACICIYIFKSGLNSIFYNVESS
ncbi:unnamed protein product [Medioppia subpectinata]|uniref:Uncharacterized protein n=1 Tax=Medioppia subpectinata TaxID=1979941 RepID=A0A7R9L5Z9_9ACAR|nr:unnamed protein product [Medioppia subpectinata]CAG2116022.1 unnamed protein product [Medioppia subpectinata]